MLPNKKYSYDELSFKYNELKDKHKKLIETVRITELALGQRKKIIVKNNEQMEFLRERIIKKYGREAYRDLLATLDNPVAFDAAKFNVKTREVEQCKQEDQRGDGASLERCPCVSL